MSARLLLCATAAAICMTKAASSSEIIYSEGFSNCDIDLGDAEMLCDVGFEVLWTLQRTGSNSHRIENGALVIGNKGDGSARSLQTVIDVFDFTNLELNVQIVSPPGSQGVGDETKCRVLIDNVVQTGVRQGVTDVFKFTNIVAASETIVFKLENDKDKSKGPCEFDDFVLTGDTLAPTASPTSIDFAPDPPGNITAAANEGNDVLPILAPTIAVLGVLGVVLILLMRQRRRMMHDDCEDMHDSEQGANEAIVPAKSTDVKYKRGGVRIKRKLNADYIEPRVKREDSKDSSVYEEEGRSRGELQRVGSSEETQDSDSTGRPWAPTVLGPSVEYLKRIQTQAHKSIFRPSSTFLQKAAKNQSQQQQQRQQAEHMSSRRSYPRESIDQDIDV